MKDIKKVTLIGLGAMGVFFAPRISEKLGADFRILADGARKERLERKGVTVNTINYRFPIITPDVEGDPADLVIIAVKGYDLEQAIKTDLRLYHQPRTVTFRVAGRTFVLPAEDILCAESRDHGSVLHTTHGEQFILCPLSQMQEYLPKDRFCRCHNSFIVNLFHIRRVSSRTIYLTDGRDLSIGRRYMEQFQDQFVRYLNQN